MRIYFGGTTDNSDEMKREISEIIKSLLQMTGENIIIFNPLDSYLIGTNAIEDANIISYVKDVNEFAMLKSDLVIFLLNDKMSFGLPIDIEFCARNDKKFIVLDRSTRSSIYLKVLIKRSAFGVRAKDLNDIAQYFTQLGEGN